MVSVNQKSHEILQNLCGAADEYGVSIRKADVGATIVDVGIQAKGGFYAGKTITEICMGGLGEARILPKSYGNVELPSIYVQTDRPALATLGCQYAGWQIRSGDFSAIGSGPARALALKPRSIYKKLKYQDRAAVAVIVLETSQEPQEKLIKQLSFECGVSPSQLYVILVPTTSVAGSTQVSGRIVETGIHKLDRLGIDPLSIQHAWGCAPIAPSHPKFKQAMGKTNDAILYGGVAYYALKHEDAELKSLLKKAPSSASKQYGKPFTQIFEEANCDFYQIDPLLFAPASLIVNNMATGNVFQAGKINVEILKQSLGF